MSNKMKTIFPIFLVVILLNGCFETHENPVENVENKSSSEVHESGPPWDDTCVCSFDKIGEIKMSKNRIDIFISGKGWDSELESCTWPWGELINNESTEDTLVTDFRIHLLDIEELPDKLYNTFFDSNIYKTKLIASYYLQDGEEYSQCVFDPNNTGDYEKPKQWVE